MLGLGQDTTFLLFLPSKACSIVLKSVRSIDTLKAHPCERELDKHQYPSTETSVFCLPWGRVPSMRGRAVSLLATISPARYKILMVGKSSGAP